jgi:hypothetical protein
MNHCQVFQRLAAVALLSLPPASLLADEMRGDDPANPAAKTLSVPDAPSLSAVYLDPKLREEGADAIERSDVEQAKKIATEAPALQSPKSGGREKPAAKPAPPPAHGGHAGHEPSADDSKK